VPRCCGGGDPHPWHGVGRPMRTRSAACVGGRLPEWVMRPRWTDSPEECFESTARVKPRNVRAAGSRRQSPASLAIVNAPRCARPGWRPAGSPHRQRAMGVPVGRIGRQRVAITSHPTIMEVNRRYRPHPVRPAGSRPEADRDHLKRPIRRRTDPHH
jgi:hypothetical protein